MSFTTIHLAAPGTSSSVQRRPFSTAQRVPPKSRRCLGALSIFASLLSVNLAIQFWQAPQRARPLIEGPQRRCGPTMPPLLASGTSGSSNKLGSRLPEDTEQFVIASSPRKRHVLFR